MIKITIIAMGKLKEKFFVEAAREYEKRLSRFCKLSIIELEPQKLPEKPNDNQVGEALKNEAAAILKHIPNDSYVTALCVEGKQLSSEKLSAFVASNMDCGKPLTFVIGSSFGLHETIKNRADLRLSMSEMTFPHRLFRVMLLEQIYRAFQINAGSEYHK